MKIHSKICHGRGMTFARKSEICGCIMRMILIQRRAMIRIGIMRQGMQADEGPG